MRDHERIGRSLAAAAAAVWKSDGELAARQAIDAVSQHFTTMKIQWVAADEVGSFGAASAPSAATPPGQPVTRVLPGKDGSVWSTVVPLDVSGAHRGVIELTEPMTSEEHFVRSTIHETAAMAVALAVVSATLAFVMGQCLVGARVQTLSEKARRIGLGDFIVTATDTGTSGRLATTNRSLGALGPRLQSPPLRGRSWLRSTEPSSAASEGPIGRATPRWGHRRFDAFFQCWSSVLRDPFPNRYRMVRLD